MKEERQLFVAVLASNDFEGAIGDYTQSRTERLEDDDDDIEYF